MFESIAIGDGAIAHTNQIVFGFGGRNMLTITREGCVYVGDKLVFQDPSIYEIIAKSVTSAFSERKSV